MAPVDLCCLLANALDNAMEACMRGDEDGRTPGWIRVRAEMRGEYWILEVKNPIDSPVPVQEGREESVKRVRRHGIGLQNMRAVVERYGGVMDIKIDSCFVLSVMIPLPLATEK